VIPEGIDPGAPYLAEVLGLVENVEIEPGAEDTFSNSSAQEYAEWLCYVNHLNAISFNKATGGWLYFMAYYRDGSHYNILCRLPSARKRKFNGVQAFWMATFNPDHTVATSTGPTANMGDVKHLLTSKRLDAFLSRYTAEYVTDFIGIYIDQSSGMSPVPQLWKLLVGLGPKLPVYRYPPLAGTPSNLPTRP
jgi:hypothetical protein